MATSTDFRQHLEVETPEHVVLDYEIAGLGSRALAAIIDHLLLMVWLIAMLIMIARFLPASGGEWIQAITILLVFLSIWCYFTFFEALRNGQTPGKRWLGIRVVQDTGHALTMGSAVARNLLRVADFMPPPYLIGAVFVGLHPRGKRLGDIVAGTVVVRDRPGEAMAAPVPSGQESQEPAAGVPELSDEEFHFLREFAERAAQLPPDVRLRVASRLTERLGARYPNRSPDAELFLTTLYQDELARRRGRFSGRSTATGTAAGTGRGVADRLVARKSTRWDEFQAMAERAARAGLDSFAAEELPAFAARYREVAADLARARTYHASPPVLARLERLVSAGHNALYRDERRTGHSVWQFIARECPAGVIEARRAVLLAFLMFALPAGGGYLLLRDKPALAQEVLPSTMLERAEAGKARQAEGKGYVEEDFSRRPLMASYIMTNNIQVAFFCFAGGIFAGVGSLVLLAYNGLSLGAISGHFANAGLLGYLWTFVIGHGVLELFAIWVAGAAGFLLGKAFIAPGNLSRGEALALAGRLALRMIGTVVVLLIIAGLIEGFVSAGSQPLAWRLGVSAASLLFLVAYLANGWAWLRQKSRPVAGALR
jgi:uncharacterized membrane protein SpoIIM required for sporulation/uncharacterized RDD family membrane protein YckC